MRASTAPEAMILSLPEMEFDVMSVSSSIEPSVAAWASLTSALSASEAPRLAVRIAVCRMRVMMFCGARNQNT